jgi:hypothetical protein
MYCQELISKICRIFFAEAVIITDSLATSRSYQIGLMSCGRSPHLRTRVDPADRPTALTLFDMISQLLSKRKMVLPTSFCGICCEVDVSSE